MLCCTSTVAAARISAATPTSGRPGATSGALVPKKRRPQRWFFVTAPGRGSGWTAPGASRAEVLHEPWRVEGLEGTEEDLVGAFGAGEQEPRRRAPKSTGAGSSGGLGGKKSKVVDAFAKSGVVAGTASKAAREAKVVMSAMRQAELAKLTAHADRVAQSNAEATTSYGMVAADTADHAVAVSDAKVGMASSDLAAREPDTGSGTRATEQPRSPRPTNQRAMASALAKVNLGKTVTTSAAGARVAPTPFASASGSATTGNTQQQRRAKSVGGSSAAALQVKPVDAATAAAVLGLGRRPRTPSLSTSDDGAIQSASGNAGAAPMSKATTGASGSVSSSSSAAVAVHANVSAPTGSGAHKGSWASFVDWKMMEHQDYQTIPNDQFEMLSQKLHIKAKWRPMVSYLVSLGLSTKELEKVLVNCEELFNRPVAKIVTRVEFLQNELGFEASELRQLINKAPKILLQRNRHSIPRCRYLTEVGIPFENLSTMLRKQPAILHLSVEKGLKPKVAYFKNELLISDAEMPKLIERNPAVLTFSVENQIKPRVAFLKNLGISHEGVSKMIVRHPHLLQYSFEGLEEHINFLSSIGMNEEDMVLTVTRLSQLFSLSVANSLRPKFKYLTEELGGTVQTCVKFPAYFSLSLDQRIRPRHTFLQRCGNAPDPFPMKYLSEGDLAFAARASKSLEEFVEYKEHVVPLFKQETERRRVQAAERSIQKQQQGLMQEARLDQQRRMAVQNQGYSQRIIDARNSMNRVKLQGAGRMPRG
eukprot:CAMPEP_0181371756 /NCGR_PEP_ID=MMETSP1106-20121128/14297_1 /TAXON_ID=81844 /ORGANISM="Mantoniella antarctica, Strain SL-175" /LENGTH=761 /DNA_ID=CAMNT_0023488973 /DNA_START=246 /DNA_END=2531 /DNA_ORIENTATION=-